MFTRCLSPFIDRREDRKSRSALPLNGRACLNQNGSVFVVTLAVVVIASIIVSSCLVYITNQREREARVSDQDAKTAVLEDEIRLAKENIRYQAVISGQVDLSLFTPLPTNDLTAVSLAFLASGSEDKTITIPAIAPLNTAALSQSGVRLETPSDPFAGATAEVARVAVAATAMDKTASSARIVDKTVTAAPEIDIRQIPISEFTLYAAGRADLQLDAVIFPEGIGRVFAEGNVDVRGVISSAYPLVSGGVVNANGAGRINFSDPPGIALTGAAGSIGDAQWVDNARTQFAAKIVTPDVLPVDLAPAFSVLASNAADKGTPQLNITGLGALCDITIMVNGQGSPRIFWTRTGQPVQGLTEVSANNNNEIRRPAKPGVPSVVLGSYSDEGGVRQAVLALNYATLPTALPIQSVYFVAANGAGQPDAHALVLLRSADVLRSNFSVVTPNRLGIEGDFNAGTNSAFGASLITPLDVETFPAGSFSQLGAAR